MVSEAWGYRETIYFNTDYITINVRTYTAQEAITRVGV
jgi:hypothetical protein